MMSGSAAGLPDISRATSNPSTMPSSRWVSAMVPVVTFTATSAPIRRANSSRGSLTSVTTTYLAPTWRTTAAAISPIGPAPVISTSSPTSGNDSAVCTALPNGSKMAAMSRSAPDMSATVLPRCTQTFDSGITTYSANAPSRLTPMLLVRMHRCRRPARQFRQVPHTTWPSPDTTSPTRTSRTRVAGLDHLAAELVAGDQRRVERAGRPVVPVTDVQVGAADAGPQHPDLHVTGTDAGLRAVREFESRHRSGFVQGLHRVDPAAPDPPMQHGAGPGPGTTVVPPPGMSATWFADGRSPPASAPPIGPDLRLSAVSETACE